MKPPCVKLNDVEGWKERRDRIRESKDENEGKSVLKNYMIL